MRLPWLPAAGRGVDLFGEALEPYALTVELCDGLDKVFKRAAEAVQAPHYKGVSVPQVREGLR